MAHFSELKDESEMSKVEVPQACRNDGFFVKTDLYVEFGGADRLRSLFEQVLSYFLKGVSVNKDVIMAFPPKLGDGVEADLFTLFWVVRKIGNYELVSKNELWEFVAEECGLDITHVGSLKLIYVKYLKELDQWLSKGGFKDKKKENIEIGVIEKLDLLSRGLDGYRKSLIDGEIVGFKDDKKGKCVGLESGYIGGMLGQKKHEGASGFNHNGRGTNLDMAKTSMSFSRINGDDDKRCELSPDNVVKKVGFSMINDDNKSSELSPDNVVKKVGFSVINDDDKRSELSPENVIKTVELSMINDDDDDDDDDEFSVENNKRIELSIKNVVDEVLRFHSVNDVALTAKDDDGDNVVSHSDNDVQKFVSSQKRKREGESMFLSEMLDWVANVARDPHDITFETSQRSSKRKNYRSDKLWKQALLARRALFAQLNIHSGNEECGSQKKNQMMHPAMYDDDRVHVHLSFEGKRCSGRATSAKPCSCPGCMLRSSSRTTRHRTEPGKSLMDQISETIKPQQDAYNLGSLYQAEVPAWSHIVSESEPKWLGTQMWPPPDDYNGKYEKVTAEIGLGRQTSCECLYRGSAECVRFHIAENRLKVKQELGDLFYKWKFNLMGEELSLSWEPEEEKIFKSLVIRARQDLTHSSRSRHEIMNKFWRRASDSLPAKPKQKLVSYYFNVFVLRRRSYQNRVTPRDIDSDNDEDEVGSVGDRFGYEKIHGLSLKCSENMQCRDLES